MNLNIDIGEKQTLFIVGIIIFIISCCVYKPSWGVVICIILVLILIEVIYGEVEKGETCNKKRYEINAFFTNKESSNKESSNKESSNKESSDKYISDNKNSETMQENFGNWSGRNFDGRGISMAGVAGMAGIGNMSGLGIKGNEGIVDNLQYKDYNYRDLNKSSRSQISVDLANIEKQEREEYLKRKLAGEMIYSDLLKAQDKPSNRQLDRMLADNHKKVSNIYYNPHPYGDDKLMVRMYDQGKRAKQATEIRASHNKATLARYFEEELNQHENSIWWDDDSLEHKF